MEYIYLHDTVWDNKHKSIPVKRGIIVTNVINTGHGYEFTIKETNEKRKSQYTWAFAENTPSNLERIKYYLDKEEEYITARNIMNKARKNVITLERTKEEIRKIKLTEF